jgi:hypothetical protein
VHGAEGEIPDKMASIHLLNVLAVVIQILGAQSKVNKEDIIFFTRFRSSIQNIL